eukprot:TRINITY_DN5756_c0_g1_i3.p2 TRINITY_DN5756_c0_g1~~TRINITY_DN5756_c0_g1_i3.p2  ORF type:complete len:146 (+),score=1.51 TRINITY_DN5756_c0_g1_i3:78-515(+)
MDRNKMNQHPIFKQLANCCSFWGLLSFLDGRNVLLRWNGANSVSRRTGTRPHVDAAGDARNQTAAPMDGGPADGWPAMQLEAGGPDKPKPTFAATSRLSMQCHVTQCHTMPHHARTQPPSSNFIVQCFPAAVPPSPPLSLPFPPP